MWPRRIERDRIVKQISRENGVEVEEWYGHTLFNLETVRSKN